MTASGSRSACTALILMLMNHTHAAGAPDALPPCPDTPNCVSSQSTDPEHYIAPVAFTGPAEQAMQRMQRVLSELPRSSSILQTGDYSHFEVRSLVFRFVDDIECLLDAENQVIHIRSASRTGHSDFGVNRRRVEHIRDEFGKF